jgi:hypothetical protein
VTGPNYPPSPQTVADVGGGAVGVNLIGGAGIGSVSQYNYWNTVISQYANSPRLVGLIQGFMAFIDQTQNLDSFFDLIWNVDTAQGYGLDVWGRIVAVNRVLKISTGPPYFGFDEGVDYQDFGPGGLGPFYSGGKLTDNFSLSDDGFRVLILAKAFSNICNGSIPAINQLLQTFFKPSGKSYVVDTGGMTFKYVFEFPLSPLQLSILTNSGVFPKPTGVSYTIVQL